MTTPRLSRSVVTGPVVPGRTGVVLLGRIRGQSGALVTQASLTSIAYTLSNLSAGTTLGTGTFAVSSSVFDSLQQSDLRWQVDSAGNPGPDGAWGYNFAGSLAGTLFPLATLVQAPGPLTLLPAPQLVQADVAFTDTSNNVWRVSWQWQVGATYG